MGRRSKVIVVQTAARPRPQVQPQTVVMMPTMQVMQPTAMVYPVQAQYPPQAVAVAPAAPLPRRDATVAVPGGLPPGWEARQDARTGRLYFVHHASRTTTFQDPRQAQAQAQAQPQQQYPPQPQPPQQYPPPGGAGAMPPGYAAALAAPSAHGAAAAAGAAPVVAAAPTPDRLTLKVRCVEARGLPAMDMGGTSDPYLELRLRGDTRSVKTRVIKKTLDPCWEEVLNVYPKSDDAVDSDTLVVKCYDHNSATANQFIGVVEFLTINLREKHGLLDDFSEPQWYHLEKKSGKPGRGEVKLAFMWGGLDDATLTRLREKAVREAAAAAQEAAARAQEAEAHTPALVDLSDPAGSSAPATSTNPFLNADPAGGAAAAGAGAPPPPYEAPPSIYAKSPGFDLYEKSPANLAGADPARPAVPAAPSNYGAMPAHPTGPPPAYDFAAASAAPPPAAGAPPPPY